MSERFRILDGEIVVAAPGEKPERHPVTFFYDSSDGGVGVLIRGNTQLRGHVVKVAGDTFERVKKGQAAASLTMK
jgi:hypothetical protein